MESDGSLAPPGTIQGRLLFERGHDAGFEITSMFLASSQVAKVQEMKLQATHLQKANRQPVNKFAVPETSNKVAGATEA